MSENWFVAQPSHAWLDIKPVVIDRATDASVFIEGFAVRKESGWNCYYPTWDAAKAAIIANRERTIAGLKLQLDRARSALDIARKLTQSTE